MPRNRGVGRSVESPVAGEEGIFLRFLSLGACILERMSVLYRHRGSPEESKTKELDMKAEVNNQTPKVEYTFHLTGDREVFVEDGFATWVLENYSENALHEWVMNLIGRELNSIYDGHLMTDEEYAEKAEEIYNRHA